MSAGHLDAMAALRKLALTQFRNKQSAAINLHAPKPVVQKKKTIRRKGKM